MSLIFNYRYLIIFSVFGFQGTNTSSLSGIGCQCYLTVEMERFELLTPCLQGRCSPNWATPPQNFFCFCSCQNLPGMFSSTGFCLTVGLNGLEPSTSRLSGVRSNQLSYKPWVVLVSAYLMKNLCWKLASISRFFSRYISGVAAGWQNEVLAYHLLLPIGILF